MPHDQGLADMHDYRDLEVIAVNMPNDPGVRNVDWNTYRTTVDAIEALTGYDLLALLPDDVEAAVESNTQPPLAAHRGSGRRDCRRRLGDVRRVGLARSERLDRELRLGLRRRQHGQRRLGVAHLRAGRCVHGARDGDRQRWPHRFGHVRRQRDQRCAGGRRGAECHAECRRDVHGVGHASRIRARTPGPRRSTGAMAVRPKWCR